MSLENEARSSSDLAVDDASSKINKGLEIKYDREFLLSFSELECCKNLPSGFDRSLLSEFEEASYVHDRLRTHSNLPLQGGYRRPEYGSPPTRGDSGNLRPNYGRWESRTTGRSDRDSDTQSEKETDPGKRFGNQSQKTWQGAEHDGLLGSGSFPRPLGMPASKVRPNDQQQLNRTYEPYHPPRPYKAAPLSRRDTDAFNDETFGSTEHTSQDRAEEERKRRASFELIRKEQHKALQEKQKPNLDKPNPDSISDVSLLLDITKKEKVVLNRDDDSDATSKLFSLIDAGKPASQSQPPFRPLVPPGFKPTVVDKTSGLKSSFHQSHSVENGILSSLDRIPPGEVRSSDEPPEVKSIHVSLANKVEQSASPLLHSNVSSKKIGAEDLPHQTYTLPESHDIPNRPEFVKLDANASDVKLAEELKENHSTSLLDKIFGNATSVNVNIPVGLAENHDSEPDYSWIQETPPASKFARWFGGEVRKTEDERASRPGPNNLLSLIVGNDKGRNQIEIQTAPLFPPIVGNDKGRNQVEMQPVPLFPPEFPDQRPEIANTPVPNAIKGFSLPNAKSQEVIPAILTCEDLEQTILSEYDEKDKKSQPPLEGFISNARLDRPRAHVDNHASQHLLSLLQNKATQVDVIPEITPATGPAELPPASHGFEGRTATCNTGPEVSKDIDNAGETLTLETLFGTAFMKELKSGDAPVSVKRGSLEDTLEPQGMSFPTPGNSLFPSSIEVERITDGENFLASNRMQHGRMERTGKWSGYDDPQTELNLNNKAGVLSKLGSYNGSVEYHLPEEESLIAVNQDPSAQMSRLIPGRNLSRRESSASNISGDLAEKLAAMATVTDERAMGASDGPPFLPGSYNQMEHEIAYHEHHGQPPSSHFQALQLGHGRPLLHSLDSHPSHINSQMKFTGRDGMIQHEAPANQQFPGTMLRPPFSQPNVGVSGFDLPPHHQMAQQMQMQMQGNFPPHLVNDFQRGAPMPRLGSQPSGFMQDINSAQGPFGPRPPNVQGAGMPVPGPVHSGSNHPDPLRRRLENELRAQQKQIPPFAGPTQPIYGQELDMSFRYR